MPIIDLSKIISKYKTGWLAISPKTNELIARAKTLSLVLKKARQKGIESPVVFKSVSVKNLSVG